MTTDHGKKLPDNAVPTAKDTSSFTPDTWTPLTAELRAGFLSAYDGVRRFRDAFTSGVLSAEAYRALSADLNRWSEHLESNAVDEAHQLVGRLPAPAPAFKALLHQPRTEILSVSSTALRGTVQFGRYHLGGGGAAHGGAVSLFMDQVVGDAGRLDGRAEARTATLTTRFVSPAPIDEVLSWESTIDQEDGRKRWCSVRLARDNGTLCAQADSLLIVPRPENTAQAYWRALADAVPEQRAE